MIWLEEIMAVFRAPTAESLAIRQFEDCKRELLNAQAALEAYKHQVACLTERRSRLARATGAEQ